VFVTVSASPDFSDHEHVGFVHDAGSGLRAIIAIHNTARGPALGGCRVWNYADEAHALSDVLRLSRGMTYKAAVADLPFGGGKCVVLVDPDRPKTSAMMRALGRAIERLGGAYVTGEDVGTTMQDMAEIGRSTTYVMGLPREAGGSGDPSANTARGCYAGIRASTCHAFGTDRLQGVRVAVQGLGNVGYHLCALLAAAGARLVVADVDAQRVVRCVEEFAAEAVDPSSIHDADVDVFAPCALGAILDPQTIPRLRARIVAGAANNQLATSDCGQLLSDRNILYAPDYAINAGGMIQLAAERLQPGQLDVAARVAGIYDTLLDLYRTAAQLRIPTNLAADRLAEQRFAARRP
jgi:leucine dehydrogenase